MALSCRALLANARWISVPVRLRNARTADAMEHPLSVMQAVCRYAARKGGFTNPWFIHPTTPFPDRIHKGCRFDFSVVFTDNPTDASIPPEHAASCMIEGLHAHLADGANNFALESIGPVALQSIADLAHDNFAADEICLDFITPIPYSPGDPQRRWLLNAEELYGLFAKRLSVCFGIDISPLKQAFDSLRLLPYYWHFFQTEHHSKSSALRHAGDAHYQHLKGMRGPLYIRGKIAPLLPLFRLGEAIHIGTKMAGGAGCYRIELGKSYFDDILALPQTRRRAFLSMQEDTDTADILPDSPGLLDDLYARVLDGTYAHAPVACHTVKKRDGRPRCIGMLQPEDSLVHKMLNVTLSPVFDRMFEHASVGFRRGRSVETAIQHIEQAVAEGREWILESDIAAFFDSVRIPMLETLLDACMPSADTVTRDLIAKCLHAPRQGTRDTSPPGSGNREQSSLPAGLLQGSPLSPLLANLYLDPFDEGVAAAGHVMIRYADDFVILTHTKEQAEAALEHVRNALAEWGLSLNEAKTAVRPVAEGFRFLGQTVCGTAHEAFSRETARESVKKTAYVQQQYVSLHLDYDAILVRQKGEAIHRVPLHRVGEVAILGTASVSTRLLQRCAQTGIPVTFCGPTGYYISTLRPESHTDYARLYAHGSRHAALLPDEQLEIARSLVTAKITNSYAWLNSRWPKESADLVRNCRTLISRLAHAADADALRGYEGQAAKMVHRFVNGRTKFDFFTSEQRLPRQKKDPWNVLQDFLSFLLFTRLNVLVRGKGLNPYLGFLHSPMNRYESLVCDLQEPFRYALDRLALTLVNRQELSEEDFELVQGKWKLLGTGVRTVLNGFERELVTSRAMQPGTMRQLLAAQVRLVSRWVYDDDSLIWHAFPKK